MSNNYYCNAVSVSGQIVTCRASVNCAGGDGDDLGVAARGADRCIGNPAALAYSPLGSEDCFACVGKSKHMQIHDKIKFCYVP